jgi:hypothetical protein
VLQSERIGNDRRAITITLTAQVVSQQRRRENVEGHIDEERTEEAEEDALIFGPFAPRSAR